MTAPGLGEHSRAVTVPLENLLDTDLEAPMRDGRNVDCKSLASLCQTASEQQAS